MTEATLRDPDGATVRALHLFRRSPAVSMTVPMSCSAEHVLHVARSFRDAFDMREVSATELATDLYLAPHVAADAAQSRLDTVGKDGAGKRGGAAVVLAYGAAHNSTCLVFASAEASTTALRAAVASEGETGGNAHSAMTAASVIVTLEVPDIGAAYAALAAAQWASSPFHPGAERGGSTFTAMEPVTGLVVQVADAAGGRPHRGA